MGLESKMLDNLEAPAETQRPRLGKAGALRRLALIGAALAAVAAAFAYLGGWFSPKALTPARLTDAFEDVGGVHPGFRRKHAKGVGDALRGALSDRPLRVAPPAPPILPHNVILFSVLRKTNTILAYLFFFTFLAHFGAVLFQTLVVRDGVIKRMVPWNIRPHASSPVGKGANHELR
jgi:hypothetical protein